MAHESLSKAARAVEVLKTRRRRPPEQEIHAAHSPRLVPQKVQAFIALQGRFFGKEWWEQLPREGSSV